MAISLSAQKINDQDNIKYLLIAALGVMIFMGYNLFRTLQDNANIADRKEILAQELTTLRQEHQKLTIALEYSQTKLFIEEEARNRLNYKLPGETAVSLPPQKVADLEEIDEEYQRFLERQNRANPLKWFDYFFGDNPSS